MAAVSISKCPSLYPLALSNDWVTASALEAFSGFDDHQLYAVLRDRFQCSDQQMLSVIARETGIRYVADGPIYVDQTLSPEMPLYRSDLRTCPVFSEQGRLCMATDAPYQPGLSTVEEAYTSPIDWLLLPTSVYRTLQVARQDVNGDDSLLALLRRAVERGCSDVHMAVSPAQVRVAFRIEGVLHQVDADIASPQAFVQALKLRAHMDFSTAYLPQDGRFSMDLGAAQVDVRVSSLPTTHGESIVLRLFHRRTSVVALTDLGFSAAHKTLINPMLMAANGLILVTGATGSGKTTTLYAMLDWILAQRQVSVVTLEDPVECVLPGVRQSPIQAAVGYDFAKGLRAVLRQDPDVIMVGEIRDLETASIAVEAAFTGHLVLSSLHTSDCRKTFSRLASLGVDMGMLGQALRGVLSQALLPKLCQSCVRLEDGRWTAPGCERCAYRGLDGRQLWPELLACSDDCMGVDLPHSIETLFERGVFLDFKSERQRLRSLGLIS